MPAPVPVLGIDVSQATLACAFYDAAAEKFHWERSVARSPEGVARLLQLTPPEAVWVLEPTGRYSLMVAQAARDAGRQVVLAPPQKAKRYLESLQSRAKTDRVDGRGLALFAASRPPAHPLAPYPIKSPEVEQLSQLLTARRGLVDAKVALKQRLAELPHAATALEAAIAELEKQEAALREQITTLTSKEAFPEVARLEAVHGIGRVIATAVATRLREKQHPTGDSFVADIGLDVKVRDSGTKKGRRCLSKQGDGELRRLLYLAARASLTAKGSPFRAQYERELAKGLSKTAALNAVARKMARLCWSLVKHGAKYDPERVYQPAPPQKASNQASGDSTT